MSGDGRHAVDLVPVIEVTPIEDFARGLVDDVDTGTQEDEVGIAVDEVFPGSVHDEESVSIFVSVVGDRVGAMRAVGDPVRFVESPDDFAGLLEGNSSHFRPRRQPRKPVPRPRPDARSHPCCPRAAA